jgi:hypothetical protein
MRAYSNQNTATLPSNESFLTFLNAQAAPIPAAEIRYFQADIYTDDRGHGPDDGWKDASVVVNWKVAPRLDKRQNLCLPFEVPNDRRDQVQIELE